MLELPGTGTSFQYWPKKLPVEAMLKSGVPDVERPRQAVVAVGEAVISGGHYCASGKKCSVIKLLCVGSAIFLVSKKSWIFIR